MGFLLAGFGLLNLFLGVMLFKWVSVNARMVWCRSRGCVQQGVGGYHSCRPCSCSGVGGGGGRHCLVAGQVSVCALLVAAGRLCQHLWRCRREKHMQVSPRSKLWTRPMVVNLEGPGKTHTTQANQL
jgi:hypothetical protein